MRAREREQSARLTYFKVCYLSNGYLIVEVLDYSVLPCLFFCFRNAFALTPPKIKFLIPWAAANGIHSLNLVFFLLFPLSALAAYLPLTHSYV